MGTQETGFCTPSRSCHVLEKSISTFSPDSMGEKPRDLTEQTARQPSLWAMGRVLLSVFDQVEQKRKDSQRFRGDQKGGVVNSWSRKAWL